MIVDRQPRPDVFLLPLAVSDPTGLRRLGVDPAVLARRIPDFLHQLVNQGDSGPTAMIEIQTPADEHPVRWAELDEVPEAEEAFELLPDGEYARALVLGKLWASEDVVGIELHVHFAEDLDTPCSTKLAAVVPLSDPASALRRLAERLARVIDLGFPPLPSGLLTRDGRAFFAFLEGLDGVALLSGELSIDPGCDSEALLRPLAQALAFDPGFGLALRAWHAAVASAVDRQLLDPRAQTRLQDECLRLRPRDGEACVAIADHLAARGDTEHAMAWLQHAVQLEPPPPRGLESLGIACANRGDVQAARSLWIAGLEQDGHPDFFAHLARLEFAQGDDAAAWDKVRHGLRRIHERSVRYEEWGDDGRGCGVLLAYLVEHLSERRPPAAVLAAVRGLVGVLRSAEDRIELGLCLSELGGRELALIELDAGLAGELSAEARDRGVRAVLRLKVRGFEAKFAKLVDSVMRIRDPRRVLAELERYRALEPRFWPALFYSGVARRRLGEEELALDLMAEVLRARPGQPDALAEMAAMFDRRGNPKRALECIEDALSARPGDPHLLGRRALYQHRLGRGGQARESLRAAMVRGAGTAELEEIRRQIQST